MICDIFYPIDIEQSDQALARLQSAGKFPVMTQGLALNFPSEWRELLQICYVIAPFLFLSMIRFKRLIPQPRPAPRRSLKMAATLSNVRPATSAISKMRVMLRTEYQTPEPASGNEDIFIFKKRRMKDRLEVEHLFMIARWGCDMQKEEVKRKKITLLKVHCDLQKLCHKNSLQISLLQTNFKYAI